MRALFVSLLLPLLTACAPKLAVNWSFANVEEGYDHPNRMDVYVGDEKVGESSVTPETTPNSVVVKLPKGTTEARVVNMAQYEGVWEEHTIANNYSIDCVWEGPVNPKGRTNLKLVFDLDQGTIVE